MISHTLTVELPFGIEPDEARLLLSIKLFEEGRVSLGYAAKMAGFTRRTYIELLTKRGVAAYSYEDPDELGREVETLESLVNSATPLKPSQEGGDEH